MGVAKLARMSFSATLTIVMSISAIKAAIITTKVIARFEPVTAASTMTSSAASANGHECAQARAQHDVLGLVVDADQNRHALHHFGEVARGVVRRQQREA